MTKKIKIFSYLIVIVSLFCLIVISTIKTYAAENNQLTIKNKIEEDLVDGKTYYLNGFRYTYSVANDRFTASLSQTPENEKYVVIYDNINGKTINYNAVTNIATYTNLEDAIVYSSFNAKKMLATKSFKNLYMAHNNMIEIDFADFTFDNYHFVAPYSALYIDILTMSNNQTQFNNMTFSNAYYYEWNELFFETYADKYNLSTGATHAFTIKTESFSKYTKESFYPCTDFKILMEKCGIKYYHSSNSSPVPSNPTNDNMPHTAYEVDSRIKSATIPLVSSSNLIIDLTYNKLDLRGYSLTALSKLKGDTIILTNATASFAANYVSFKNVYFVYDPNGVSITSVTGTPSTIEKVYIPEAHKTHFSSITTHATLGSKVVYYTEDIKIDFEFTNTAGTKTYKSSDDYIDIDTTLNSIKRLEDIGIKISTTEYANEVVESYNLPTKLECNNTYSLKPIDNIYCKKGINPTKLLDAIKPYVLLKGNQIVEEQYNITYNSKEFKFNEDGELKFFVEFPDKTKEEKKINVNYIEFDHSASFITSGNYVFIVTNKSDETLEKVFQEYIEKVIKLKDVSIYSEHDFKEKGRTLTSYKNADVQNIIEVNVVDNALNYKINYLELIKEKLEENLALKYGAMAISSIISLGMLYLGYLLCRKGYKWIKK